MILADCGRFLPLSVKALIHPEGLVGYDNRVADAAELRVT